MADETIDETTGEVLPEVTGKHMGAVEVQKRTFEPSPLALLSDDDFTRRVQLAQLEAKRMREIQLSVMEKDVDYGTIPGTPKPTLYQPGAQILNRMAGFRPEYHPDRTDGDGLHAPDISYEVRCQLLDRDGYLVAEGWGSANSWEKKHRYRYNDRVCPLCGVAAIMPSRYDEKYYCFGKKGGCGAKFAEGPESERIDAQPKMMENPDPHELSNTLLKMACKRANIAATLQAHACSGQFAQDLGDVPGPEEQRDAQNHPAAAPQRAQSPSQARSQATRAPREKDLSPLSEGRVKLCYAKLCARMQELGHEVNEDTKHAARDIVLDGYEAADFTEVQTCDLDDILKAIAGMQ